MSSTFYVHTTMEAKYRGESESLLRCKIIIASTCRHNATAGAAPNTTHGVLCSNNIYLFDRIQTRMFSTCPDHNNHKFYGVFLNRSTLIYVL